MRHRELGQSGITVPPLCFGCNIFGWTIDEDESFSMLDRLVDAGLTFLDTADVYSIWVPGHKGGESETIIGRWLTARGIRDRMIIATKVGADLGAGKSGLSPHRIREAVDASLKRLGTDYIDLYQSHIDDQNTPFAETLEVYGDLIQAGKIRAIGASNHTGKRLAEVLSVSVSSGLPRYETVQPLYNLMDRADFEDELEQVCLEEHLGVIPFYSLASGFLTGKYRSKADLSKGQRGNRVEKYLGARGDRVLAALDNISGDYAVKPATVALAWMMAKPAITSPIVSATSAEQLHDLVAAMHLTLAPEAVQTLDEASAPLNE